jgi:hypothetical protein
MDRAAPGVEADARRQLVTQLRAPEMGLAVCESRRINGSAQIPLPGARTAIPRDQGHRTSPCAQRHSPHTGNGLR